MRPAAATTCSRASSTQKFEELSGAKVVIENRAGAGGRLAAEYTARQPADGYTVMVGATGQMSIAAATYPNLAYHPTKSFIPLNMIASFPLVMVVSADIAAQNATGCHRLRQGQSGQGQLRDLFAGLHDCERSAQAEIRHAVTGDPLQEQQ